MAHSISTRLVPYSLAACFAAAAGCSAAGGSGGPEFTEADGASAAPPSSVEPSDGSGMMPPPVTSPGSTPPAASETGACATASAQVEIVRQPVDIIIALDNSGSMDDEARAVEANINVNFAEILQSSQVDYRVILVSEHRERRLQDTAICILSPLSTLATCPSDAPGPSDRFFQYSTEINSSNSFDVLLETYDGSREDDFGLAPAGWSQWLRPGAQKVFVEITDDDANTSAGDFVAALTALAPQDFGADPSQLTFVWHSIVGLAQRPNATDPYVPGDPIEEGECDGDVFNAGTTYQELSRETGGLRFPICEFDGYDVVFQRIANSVVQTSGGACDFALPAPPSGRALDLDKVAVSYTPGSGVSPQLLGRVAAAADCRTGAFVVDGAGVHLCPEACDVVAADADAAVDVLFTCASTLLR
ncbi:MAG TPA: hypothetical protein VMG12_28820 [Polyangiaceae bacterium]|nr:hypothetical protein [Polyangiaceae bacterium]